MALRATSPDPKTSKKNKKKKQNKQKKRKKRKKNKKTKNTKIPKKKKRAFQLSVKVFFCFWWVSKIALFANLAKKARTQKTL